MLTVNYFHFIKSKFNRSRKLVILVHKLKHLLFFLSEVLNWLTTFLKFFRLLLQMQELLKDVKHLVQYCPIKKTLPKQVVFKSKITHFSKHRGWINKRFNEAHFLFAEWWLFQLSVFIKIDKDFAQVNTWIRSYPLLHILSLINSLTTDSAKAVFLWKLLIVVNIFPLVASFLSEQLCKF